MKAALALPMLLLSGPAAAENWQHVADQGDYRFDVDTDSIRNVDGGRFFRIRLSHAEPNQSTAIYEAVADCGAGLIDMLHSETTMPGKGSISHDYKPGESRSSMEPALKPMVCGQ